MPTPVADEKAEATTDATMEESASEEEGKTIILMKDGGVPEQAPKKEVDPVEANVGGGRRDNEAMNDQAPTEVRNTADEEADDAAAMPLPGLARNHRVRPAAIPGAFAHGVGPEEGLDGQAVDLADPEAPVVHETNDEGLAVANPVEEAQNDLQQAQGVNFNVADSRRDETKQWRRNTIMVVGVLLLALLVVVAIVLATDKDNDKEVVPSPTPSFAPSEWAPTSVKEKLVSLLPQHTLTALEDSESAQSKALKWMFGDDNLALLSSERMVQRYALATLYYATTSNDTDWIFNTDWLSDSVHECQWFNMPDFAMKSVLQPLYPGYFAGFALPEERCDEDERLQNLWLDTNNLVGTLPEELYLLTSLKTLSLGYNQLQGTLSPRIADLTSLEALVIYAMQNPESESPIPTQIGLLSNLRALSLYENNHDGNLPTELWSLTGMEHLTIGVNQNLIGAIPTQIGLFSSLRFWNFDQNNMMDGTLPTEIGQVSSLGFFILLDNNYSGHIPSELGLLSKITSLTLFGNRFSGTIPTTLGMLSADWFDLGDNLLRGPIPSEFGLLTTIDSALELHKNPYLTGTLPTEFGLLTDVALLRLYNMSLSGPIPSQLGLLTSMSLLDLNNNTLSGTIPEELSALADSLYYFRLDHNPKLTGTVPSSLCSVTGTCTPGALFPCETTRATGMVHFDCSSNLCGCNCNCSSG